MDGIIIINKQKNYTSNDVVQIVKKTFNEKTGHTGTLDPNATGVLPLLVGKGTKLSKYLINHDKIYEVVLKLGEKRDTADSEGNVIENKEICYSNINKENINKVFNTFIGKQEQKPPMYSAIKVNGKKLYEYARKGETIEVKPRTINIYKLELINIDKEKKQIEFRIHCSKGTYIRTVCENVAEKLETVGYMKELKRTQVGEFKIEDSISIEELEEKKECITIEKYFKNYKNINLDSKRLQLFLNGVKLTWQVEDGIYKIYNNGNFIGIGTVKNNLLKRDIII